MNNNIFALGWDVGGWMGKNNCFVLIEADKNNNKLSWFFDKKDFQIKKGKIFELSVIIESLYKQRFGDYASLVIGIDAPLTFPVDFIDFINQKDNYVSKPDLEIFNPLAYRATDRYIYCKYGKKPLSATFDRLGNNLTVAVSHLRAWARQYDLDMDHNRFVRDEINIIETYPALVKPGKYKKAYQIIDDLIPEEIMKGTDQYDAALCALMGVQFAFKNEFEALPYLVFPPKEKHIYNKEGWIYHFDLEDIKR